MKKKSNNFLRMIKKNKLLTLLIVLFVLVIILGLVAIKVLIFPSYNTSKYGNRLDNINNVKINDDRFSEVKNSFTALDGINIKNYRLSGRIVNIYIEVNNVDVNLAKENINEFIKTFNEDEIKYYDFQVFVATVGDSQRYFMGYKNKNSEGLIWNCEGESSEE